MLARRIQDPNDLMNREFDRMLHRLWGTAEVPSTLPPYAVDVHEDADHFYVEAELPGFTKDDVDVTLEEGVLTLRAERKEEKEIKGREPIHIERYWTQFQRSFTLPTAVNANSVKATLDNGMLRITLDKREEVKPRKIQVNVGVGDGKHLEGEIKGDAKKA